MIFITVGEQLPFDRLVKTVDIWAGNYEGKVFAQIGKSKFLPKNMLSKSFLAPDEFRHYFTTSELIVGHAGMGTIITALELHKPLIVMPRRASLGEHRNDHQVSIAEHLLEKGIIVALNEDELIDNLNKIDEIVGSNNIAGDRGPSSTLIKRIAKFIAS